MTGGIGNSTRSWLRIVLPRDGESSRDRERERERERNGTPLVTKSEQPLEISLRESFPVPLKKLIEVD